MPAPTARRHSDLDGGRATRPLADIRMGDQVYGTVRIGRYRRFVKTPVLDQWRRIEPAYRVELEDGTRLIASADHRFLTNRGWKHVSGREQGASSPFPSTLATTISSEQAISPSLPRRLSITGPDTCAALSAAMACSLRTCTRGAGALEVQHHFRLSLIHFEALQRARSFLTNVPGRDPGVPLPARRRRAEGLGWHPHSRPTRRRTHRRNREMADGAEPGLVQGLPRGIFDAEGCYSRGILRITNTDTAIIQRVTEALARFGFDFVVETRQRSRPIHNVRVRRGSASTCDSFTWWTLRSPERETSRDRP